MAKKKYYDKKSGNAGDMMPMYSDAMSGMPQEVVMKEYKRSEYIDRGSYPDTYNEKEREYNQMVSKAKKQLFSGNF